VRANVGWRRGCCSSGATQNLGFRVVAGIDADFASEFRFKRMRKWRSAKPGSAQNILANADLSASLCP
jgi:hypothetical protein